MTTWDFLTAELTTLEREGLLGHQVPNLNGLTEVVGDGQDLAIGSKCQRMSAACEKS